MLAYNTRPRTPDLAPHPPPPPPDTGRFTVSGFRFRVSGLEPRPYSTHGEAAARLPCPSRLPVQAVRGATSEGADCSACDKGLDSPTTPPPCSRRAESLGRPPSHATTCAGQRPSLVVCCCVCSAPIDKKGLVQVRAVAYARHLPGLQRFGFPTVRVSGSGFRVSGFGVEEIASGFGRWGWGWGWWLLNPKP